MEQPIVIDAGDRDDCESVPQADIVAMLSMIDYLITHIGRIDEMSTARLVLARKSLATSAGELLTPQ